MSKLSELREIVSHLEAVEDKTEEHIVGIEHFYDIREKTSALLKVCRKLLSDCELEELKKFGGKEA